MDEIVEVAAELGTEAFGFEAVAWLIRILGVLLVLGGIGVFVLTEVTVLIPVLMILAGIVLVAAPSLAMLALELV